MIGSSGFGILAVFSLLSVLLGRGRTPKLDADGLTMESRWIRWIR